MLCGTELSNATGRALDTGCRRWRSTGVGFGDNDGYCAAEAETEVLCFDTVSLGKLELPDMETGNWKTLHQWLRLTLHVCLGSRLDHRPHGRWWVCRALYLEMDILHQLPLLRHRSGYGSFRRASEGQARSF